MRSAHEPREERDDAIGTCGAERSGFGARVAAERGDLDGGDGLDRLAARDRERARFVGAADAAGAFGAVQGIRSTNRVPDARTTFA